MKLRSGETDSKVSNSRVLRALSSEKPASDSVSAWSIASLNLVSSTQAGGCASSSDAFQWRSTLARRARNSDTASLTLKPSSSRLEPWLCAAVACCEGGAMPFDLRSCSLALWPCARSAAMARKMPAAWSRRTSSSRLLAEGMQRANRTQSSRMVSRCSLMKVASAMPPPVATANIFDTTIA